MYTEHSGYVVCGRVTESELLPQVERPHGDTLLTPIIHHSHFDTAKPVQEDRTVCGPAAALVSPATTPRLLACMETTLREYDIVAEWVLHHAERLRAGGRSAAPCMWTGDDHRCLLVLHDGDTHRCSFDDAPASVPSAVSACLRACAFAGTAAIAISGCGHAARLQVRHAVLRRVFTASPGAPACVMATSALHVMECFSGPLHASMLTVTLHPDGMIHSTSLRSVSWASFCALPMSHGDVALPCSSHTQLLAWAQQMSTRPDDSMQLPLSMSLLGIGLTQPSQVAMARMLCAMRQLLHVTHGDVMAADSAARDSMVDACASLLLLPARMLREVLRDAAAAATSSSKHSSVSAPFAIHVVCAQLANLLFARLVLQLQAHVTQAMRVSAHNTTSALNELHIVTLPEPCESSRSDAHPPSAALLSNYVVDKLECALDECTFGTEVGGGAVSNKKHPFVVREYDGTKMGCAPPTTGRVVKLLEGGSGAGSNLLTSVQDIAAVSAPARVLQAGALVDGLTSTRATAAMLLRLSKVSDRIAPPTTSEHAFCILHTNGPVEYPAQGTASALLLGYGCAAATAASSPRFVSGGLLPAALALLAENSDDSLLKLLLSPPGGSDRLAGSVSQEHMCTSAVQCIQAQLKHITTALSHASNHVFVMRCVDTSPVLDKSMDAEDDAAERTLQLHRMRLQRVASQLAAGRVIPLVYQSLHSYPYIFSASDFYARYVPVANSIAQYHGTELTVTTTVEGTDPASIVDAATATRFPSALPTSLTGNSVTDAGAPIALLSLTAHLLQQYGRPRCVMTSPTSNSASRQIERILSHAEQYDTLSAAWRRVSSGTRAGADVYARDAATVDDAGGDSVASPSSVSECFSSPDVLLSQSHQVHLSERGFQRLEGALQHWTTKMSACSVRLQHWYRARCARAAWRARVRAVSRLQAVARMRRKRISFLTQRHSCVRLQSWWRCAITSALYSYVRQAALRLQRAWRASCTRARLQQLRAALVRFHLCFRGALYRAAASRRSLAMIMIRRAVRTCLLHRAHAVACARAVTMLSALWRGFACRHLPLNARVMQHIRSVRAQSVRGRFLRRFAATMRSRRARAGMQCLRRIVTTCQRWWRSRAKRIAFLRYRYAAVAVQRWLRSRLTVKHVRLQRAAAAARHADAVVALLQHVEVDANAAHAAAQASAAAARIKPASTLDRSDEPKASTKVKFFAMATRRHTAEDAARRGPTVGVMAAQAASSGAESKWSAADTSKESVHVLDVIPMLPPAHVFYNGAGLAEAAAAAGIASPFITKEGASWTASLHQFSRECKKAGTRVVDAAMCGASTFLACSDGGVHAWGNLDAALVETDDSGIISRSGAVAHVQNPIRIHSMWMADHPRHPHAGSDVSAPLHRWRGSNASMHSHAATSPSSPRPFAAIPRARIRITSLAASDTHILMLSSDARVYAMGSNKYGECAAREGVGRVHTPHHVAARPARQVAAGLHVSALLTTTGSVYTFGHASLCGLGTLDTRLMRSTDGFRATDAVFVAHDEISFKPTAAAAASVRLSGQHKGEEAQQQAVHAPTAVAVLGKAHVISIACGARHMVALASNGDAFAWGDNSRGQCGIGAAIAHRHLPAVMLPPTTYTAAPVYTQIATGLQHTLLLDKDNNVFACGSNAFEQVGIQSQASSKHGGSTVVHTLTAVPLRSSRALPATSQRVVQIAAAAYSSFAVIQLVAFEDDRVQFKTLQWGRTLLHTLPVDSGQAAVPHRRREGVLRTPRTIATTASATATSASVPRIISIASHGLTAALSVEGGDRESATSPTVPHRDTLRAAAAATAQASTPRDSGAHHRRGSLTELLLSVDAAAPRSPPSAHSDGSSHARVTAASESLSPKSKPTHSSPLTSARGQYLADVDVLTPGGRYDSMRHAAAQAAARHRAAAADAYRAERIPMHRDRIAARVRQWREQLRATPAARAAAAHDTKLLLDRALDSVTRCASSRLYARAYDVGTSGAREPARARRASYRSSASAAATARSKTSLALPR